MRPMTNPTPMDPSPSESPLARARKRNGLSVRPAAGPVARRTRAAVPSANAEHGSQGGSAPVGRAVGAPLVPLSHAEERTLKSILSEPMDYIDHPDFQLPDAEERIYGIAEIERPDVTWYRPLMDDFIAARSRSVRSPKSQSTILLTGAQERILFMKYNFARFSISEIQKRAASRPVTLEEARQLLRWHGIAHKYREQIAETNLALVLAMAKRVRLSEVDFADLIGEGNMALMRSVDKFDCGRGFKFSTYACRAILKAFSRHGIKVTTHNRRFGAEYDPAFEKSNHLETVRATHERECADEVKHIVTANKADLSEIEIKVISHRFGIDASTALAALGSAVAAGKSVEAAEGAQPLTLEQVGQVIGVTKERVRQIQNKALEKIRSALQAANPDAASEMAADIAAREGRAPASSN
ncbi:MAG: sigma-70 family RNA polymerase sigma factor [Phycisphaera sp.]|nr:sigma-70 family RNA polymerase sigma factor [Phycisphaera sp.]